MTQQALYRFRNAECELLYVGITLNPVGRFRRHGRRDWWTEVTMITIETHPDRASVLAAEAVAIKAERPRYNVQQLGRPLDMRPGCCRKVGPWDCSAAWAGACRRGVGHHHCLGQAGHYEAEAAGCGDGCPENGHCAPRHFCLCGSLAETS